MLHATRVLRRFRGCLTEGCTRGSGLIGWANFNSQIHGTHPSSSLLQRRIPYHYRSSVKRFKRAYKREEIIKRNKKVELTLSNGISEEWEEGQLATTRSIDRRSSKPDASSNLSLIIRNVSLNMPISPHRLLRGNFDIQGMQTLRCPNREVCKMSLEYTRSCSIGL